MNGSTQIALDLWQLIMLSLALLGAFTGLVKLLLLQFAAGVNKQLSQLADESKGWRTVEKELMQLRVELPERYVRREDYIRNQTVIETKLDLLGEKMERRFNGGKATVIDGIDLAKRRREHIRWILLRALDNARPSGTNEIVLLQTIQGIYVDATQQEIRRELDYLQTRDLVEIHGRHTGLWAAELGRYGVDVVEYTVDCEPGIARPPKVI